MTYRERRSRRADRLREWAGKRQQKSTAAFNRARTIADAIPFGQPILVGHHSERHARRDQDRIHNGMAAGIEHQRKADSMNGRATEIDRQADRAIYSDDPDAIEQLQQRIADLEQHRDRMKGINKEIRRGPGWAERIAPPLTEAERKDIESAARFNGCAGYPPYALRNLAGNLTRQRQRLAMLTDIAARVSQADAARTLAELAAVLNRPAPLLADMPPLVLTSELGPPRELQQSLYADIVEGE